jgi:hypothetical protein
MEERNGLRKVFASLCGAKVRAKTSANLCASAKNCRIIGSRASSVALGGVLVALGGL